MQAIGVILSVFAVWFMYCGTHGLKPVALLQAIIQKPDSASELITDALATAKSTAYIWPTGDQNTTTDGSSIAMAIGSNPFSSYKVTAPYGQSGHVGTFGSAHVHNGVDYAMPVGTKVPAVLAGNASSGFGVLSGTTLTVTGTGDYKGWSTIYMHLSHVIKTGAVLPGQLIAESGGAKGAEGAGDSTGPHLHFEVHHNGSVVDPASFWSWVSSNKGNLAAKDSSAKAGNFSTTTGNPFLSGAN